MLSPLESEPCFLRRHIRTLLCHLHSFDTYCQAFRRDYDRVEPFCSFLYSCLSLRVRDRSGQLVRIRAHRCRAALPQKPFVVAAYLLGYLVPNKIGVYILPASFTHAPPFTLAFGSCNKSIADRTRIRLNNPAATCLLDMLSDSSLIRDNHRFLLDHGVQHRQSKPIKSRG
jgi:hypothetical protein